MLCGSEFIVFRPRYVEPSQADTVVNARACVSPVSRAVSCSTKAAGYSSRCFSSNSLKQSAVTTLTQH